MNIKRIMLITLTILASEIFSMESMDREPTKVKSEENKFDFQLFEKLPREMVKEIIGYAVAEIKYPKVENAKKSENLKNIRAVSTVFRNVLNDVLQSKEKEFEKYDEINRPLFDELSKEPHEINFESIINLIKNGADVNIQDNNEEVSGNTALMMAAVENRIDIVKILIAANANLNLQNENGTTALMWAAMSGQEIVKFLIDAGADINLKENDGWTALRYARRTEDMDIIKLLESKDTKLEES